MLILSRRTDQSIVIGDLDNNPIRVMVVDIRGDKVRIGIDAPPDVQVDRLEVAIEIQRERRAGLRPARRLET